MGELSLEKQHKLTPFPHAVYYSFDWNICTFLPFSQ